MSWRERIPIARMGLLLRQSIVVAGLVGLVLVFGQWFVEPNYMWDAPTWGQVAVGIPVEALIGLLILQVLWLAIVWIFHLALWQPFPRALLHRADSESCIRFWVRDLKRLAVQYFFVGVAAELLNIVGYALFRFGHLLSISLIRANLISFSIGVVAWHLLNWRFAPRNT
jgi:hypothetical protein